MFKSVTPIQASRSTRRDRGRGVTTGKAGTIIPLRFIPLLREDQLTNAQVNVTLELAETVRPLINAVYADVQAWFVPFASFPRFKDLGDYNRAYTKTPDPYRLNVDPFIRVGAFVENEIWNKLGVHMPSGASVNMAPIEAYNVLVNHMYNERSPNLPERSDLHTNLAPCFWAPGRLSHIVPNYDKTLELSAVPVTAATNPTVKGIGVQSPPLGAAGTGVTVRETGGARNMTGWISEVDDTSTAGQAKFFIEENAAQPGYPNIRVDMGTGNLSFSLANLDLAKKTAAFEALRKRYAGHDDAEIIELLMEGIRVPEFMERQPYMLANRRVAFNFGTRYATNGGALDESVTNGIANVGMQLNMPRTNVGGVVMIVASVVPDQMFERQRDPFLAILDQDLWPKYERDTLDWDKVDQKLNVDIDTSHATPSAIFGYEPLNQRWDRDLIRLGGDLYRPSSATAYSEDRAVLWVTEPANPTITKDWYLATSMNADPFADRVKDHLTVTTIHEASISGNTVFGQPLLEALPS